MKLIIFAVFFVLTTHSHAKTEVMCALKWAKTLRPDIIILNANDKVKHCALSCQIRIHCSAAQTIAIGAVKEVWDGVSGTGTAEWKDLEADILGVKLGSKVRSSGTPEPHRECIHQCELISWD
jgi:hypothetical protein